MKFTTIISFFLFIFTVSVVTSPIAEPAASNALVSKRAGGLDLILRECHDSIKITSDDFKKQCQGSCTHDHIRRYCDAVAQHCKRAVARCKNELPIGYKWGGLVSIIVELICAILVIVNDCLLFLLGKCGLLGLLSAVLSLVIGLVSVVIVALNELLACVALYVDGLLALVAKLLITLLGGVTCILCLCGLKLA